MLPVGILKTARVELEPKAADHLRTERWNAVQALEKRFNVHIEIKIARNMMPGQAEFTFETNPDAKPVQLAAPNFGPAERRDSPEDHEPDEIDELFLDDEAEEAEASGDARNQAKRNRAARVVAEGAARKKDRPRNARPITPTKPTGVRFRANQMVSQKSILTCQRIDSSHLRSLVTPSQVAVKRPKENNVAMKNLALMVAQGIEDAVGVAADSVAVDSRGWPLATVRTAWIPKLRQSMAAPVNGSTKSRMAPAASSTNS